MWTPASGSIAFAACEPLRQPNWTCCWNTNSWQLATFAWQALKLLNSLEIAVLGGHMIAIEAARNHRRLRKLGITVRKTIDTLIATRCIVEGYQLPHNVKDFDVFEEHLGLRVVGCTESLGGVC